MAHFKMPSFYILFWITLCASKQFNGDYSNGKGGSMSGPFSSGSGTGSAGFGGKMSRDNGNSFGRSPFSSMSSGTDTGEARGPFTSAHSNGNGIGGSPFSGAATGNGKSNGASPFASALANGGGGGNGASPFSGGTSGKGSSPFKANMDGSGMPGVDLSTLMKSGPGGLIGGNFQTSNNSMLIGHDFSKDMNTNGGQFGDMGLDQGQSENKIAIDNSRFDTTAYQQMLQDLFSTDNSGQGMKDMGSPFDGNSYNYNNNNGGDYNTDKEASIGSFASTDMSYYTGNGGTTTDNENSKFQNLQKGQNTGSGNSYSSGSNMESSGSNSFSNPFDVHNYDTGNSSPNSDGATEHGSLSSMNDKQSPFSIKNSGTGKTPFSVNSNSGSTSGNGVGSGSGPFDTSKFGMSNGNSNKHSDIGQNPFDTSKYQASGAVSSMMGNQNMATGSKNYNTGLDAYGNVNFGTLSAGAGYNSRSESQYETPFETDNYNNLLDNPFKSDSYFDTTKQNFKLPYETDSKIQQSSYSNLGLSSAGYSGDGYTGSGPGGDPFNQGGHSMGGSSSMRG